MSSAVDAVRVPPRGTLGQRLSVAGLATLSAVLRRLPDAALHRLAQAAGSGLYLASPRRRRLVRSNLKRICTWLAETRQADARLAAAAADPAALEQLVRAAFGHYLRYYLEVALTPGLDAAHFQERVTVETPEALERAFGDAKRGIIIVGLHFGSIEMPGIFVVQQAGRPVTSPMEIVANRPLQAYLERTRGATGVRIIPIRDARRGLREALARGEVVGLVADRDLAGTGQVVELFGAPTRLPSGVALLAVETGAPVFVAAVRRTGYGRFAGSMIALESPPEGPLRERVRALLEGQARAFEELIARAPEQWWTIFFPIWPDLADAGQGA
jgi:KDO2-lipid IV(A) lauroyltransferase